MRKEFIIAIVSGISIGIIIAFGIWRANTALKSEEDPTENAVAPAQAEIKVSESSEISIIHPNEDDILTETPLKISGMAQPQTTLIISAEDEDYIVQTSENGSFEAEVDLVGGVNEIILAHSENGDATKVKSLRVIYSSEFEKEERE